LINALLRKSRAPVAQRFPLVVAEQAEKLPSMKIRPLIIVVPLILFFFIQLLKEVRRC
jgi:hypothetical protein